MDLKMLDVVESINLAGNRFQKGLKLTFGSGSKLQYLDLRSCQISDVVTATNIGFYLALPSNGLSQVVHLENNLLTSIPEDWNARLPSSSALELHLEGNPLTGKLYCRAEEVWASCDLNTEAAAAVGEGRLFSTILGAQDVGDAPLNSFLPSVAATCCMPAKQDCP